MKVRIIHSLLRLRWKKMNKETKLAEEKQKRFREAKKNLQKMQEEIAPFIKLRKFKKYSTEGEWRETSSLYL